jgi:mono/diheme cytochrome c family protein
MGPGGQFSMTVTILRVATAGLAGLAIGAFQVRAAGPEASADRAARAPQTPVQVFRASCVECHDGDGRGEAGRDPFPKIPDFTDARWQASRNDSDLGRSILEGKGKSMPRMRNKLGSVDVARMVAFVRAFQGGKQVVDDAPEALPAPPATASRREDPHVRAGTPLFQRFCVKCHGADGTGTSMRESLSTIPDFTRPAWQSGRSDAQLVASLLSGKGTGMPAFGNKLRREQARDLVAYVRAFAPAQGRPAGTAPDDFDARFRELADEVEALGRQIRALSPPR